jgi:hypothetical protein
VSVRSTVPRTPRAQHPGQARPAARPRRPPPGRSPWSPSRGPVDVGSAERAVEQHADGGDGLGRLSGMNPTDGLSAMKVWRRHPARATRSGSRGGGAEGSSGETGQSSVGGHSRPRSRPRSRSPAQTSGARSFAVQSAARPPGDRPEHSHPPCALHRLRAVARRRRRGPCRRRSQLPPACVMRNNR